MNNHRLLFLTFSFVIISIVVALFLYLDKRAPNIREAMTFYPIDHNIQFADGNTTLELVKTKENNEYQLNWSTHSTLTRAVALRHDFSLLFKNGMLLHKANDFSDHTKEIRLKEELKDHEEGYYEAVTFHHAEVHYPNEEIKSRQSITTDELYVIQTPITPFHAFKQPQTLEETSGKNHLNKIVYQQLNEIWQSLFQQYELNKNDYTIVTLTNLDRLYHHFSEEQAEKIIAATTDMIYSYYFFGIPNGDGTFISPIGSSLPIVLVPNQENDHLIVLFRTDNGKNIQLLKKVSL